MGRRVLVTGASRGIGRQVAERLAAAGFDIVVHYNARRDAAEETVQAVEKHGRSASLVAFDIADRASVLQQLERDIEENGPYYGVVCNAGIHADNAFPAMPGEEWDRVLRTNLDGFYNVLHPIIMPMIRTRKGGRIVVMSSVSGLMGNRGQVNYSASKGGLIAASKSLAIELAKRRITVNCVAPGIIETEMTKDVEVDRVMEMIPAQRFGKPEEVASLVAYLFSDDAAYLTRQVISVNGGMF
ncbi:MAG: 3-oxoacyl-ACP reductase FabG [Rhodobiaceae bacterium]|nr:MAG: 3-oxoacyl-ACP reductase FabG [Rhodobiaceae bacterium]